MSVPSARVEYAVLAVFELARAFRTKKPVSALKIATKYHLSELFLVKVLGKLKKSGLVETQRGQFGGFRLIPAPNELTLGYVVALAEEVNAPSLNGKKDASFSELDADARSTRFLFGRAWQDAESKRQEYLNEIVFSDLISSKPTEIDVNFSI